MIPMEAFVTLKMSRITLKFRAVTDAPLLGFIGPTLRGVLGTALHRASCNPDDSPAFPGAPCLFWDLFRARPVRGERQASAPPFILQSPARPYNGVAAGEIVEMGLIIFGDAAHLIPAVLWALFCHGYRGGWTRAHTQYELVEVAVDAPAGQFPIFAGFLGPFIASWLNEWSWSGDAILSRMRADLPESLQTLQIEFLTPLDLREQQRTVVPDFRRLVRSALRNVSMHGRLHGSGSPSLDYTGIKDAAGRVKTLWDQTIPTYLVHHSYHQDRDIPRNSRLGKMAFEGDITPFIPLLLMGQLLQAGHGRTMGFGAHRWTRPSE